MPYDDEDEPRERTGRVRLRTADEDPCAWHDRLVEHFGADGRGGDWGRAVKVIESHGTILEDFKQWKWKLLGMATLGGLVAGVLAWLIPQLIDKH